MSQYYIFVQHQQQQQIMLEIISIVFIALIGYSLIKIIRRKLSKPSFENKTVWITGASSGIGQYLAYQFSRCGARLIISARNEKQLERVKQKCTNKQSVQVVKLDMTDYQAIKTVTQQILKDLQQRGQKLDIVVQNAGVSMRAEFKDYDFKNHISMFDLNVHGPFYHLQQIVSHMIKNKSGQIVGITSVQGKLAPPFRTSYAGSKHAFVGILDSLRSELHADGIRVTNILPGYVKTNLSKNAFAANAGQRYGQQSQKGLDPDVFSREAVRAIYMKQNEAQISQTIDVPIGFFLRNLCPDLVFFGLRLKAKQKNINKNKQQ